MEKERERERERERESMCEVIQGEGVMREDLLRG